MVAYSTAELESMTAHCERPCDVRQNAHDPATIDSQGREHCGHCPEDGPCAGLPIDSRLDAINDAWNSTFDRIDRIARPVSWTIIIGAIVYFGAHLVAYLAT